MDIVKGTSILPMGDAPGRQSHPHDRDGSDNEHLSEEHKHQPQNYDSAVILAGITSHDLSPEVRSMFGTMAAELEFIRMEAKKAQVQEERYRELSMQHSFLGIPNRRETERELQHIIDHLEDKNDSVAFVIVNLSNGNAIRSHFGYRVADAAMTHLVDNIQQVIGTNDIQGSLCGFDLGIVLFNGDLGSVNTVVDNIKKNITTNPLYWGDIEHILEINTGFTVLCAGSQAHEAIEAADYDFISSRAR